MINILIIHFNTISMAANVNKLKACIVHLYCKFDVIAIFETWMNNNESEEFPLENDDVFLDNTELVVGLLCL